MNNTADPTPCSVAWLRVLIQPLKPWSCWHITVFTHHSIIVSPRYTLLASYDCPHWVMTNITIYRQLVNTLLRKSMTHAVYCPYPYVTWSILTLSSTWKPYTRQTTTTQLIYCSDLWELGFRLSNIMVFILNMLSGYSYWWCIPFLAI